MPAPEKRPTTMTKEEINKIVAPTTDGSFGFIIRDEAKTHRPSAPRKPEEAPARRRSRR